MALVNNDLYSESTRSPLAAIQPDQGPGAVVVREFTAPGTVDTLPVGFPVCVVPTTGLVDGCDPDQTSTNLHELEVFGFVWPTPIVRSSTSDTVIGTVMVKGSLPYSVISAHLTQLTGTEQQLKDMLRKAAVQSKGLTIEGLTKVGGNAGLS